MASVNDVEVSGNFCENCRGIFLRNYEPEDGELYLHHPDRAHLDTAAASGCSMCLALLREAAPSAIRSHDMARTDSLSKWSMTSELGEDNIGCYEVTLYYLTYSQGSLEPDNISKPVSVSNVHFWLQPAGGLWHFPRRHYHLLR